MKTKLRNEKKEKNELFNTHQTNERMASHERAFSRSHWINPWCTHIIINDTGPNITYSYSHSLFPVIHSKRTNNNDVYIIFFGWFDDSILHIIHMISSVWDGISLFGHTFGLRYMMFDDDDNSKIFIIFVKLNKINRENMNIYLPSRPSVDRPLTGHGQYSSDSQRMKMKQINKSTKWFLFQVLGTRKCSAMSLAFSDW